jgi:hypothetical protein
VVAYSRAIVGGSGMMMKLLDATTRVSVPGIQNLGNTCFFNAILQALASVSSFQEYLQEIERSARATSHDIPFTRALRDCLEGSSSSTWCFTCGGA